MRTQTSIRFPFETFPWIVFDNEEYTQKVYDAAKKMGAEAIDKLLTLFSNRDERMRLSDARMLVCPDFTPHSFSFAYFRKGDIHTRLNPYLVGGIIYSGPGIVLDGSGLAFTVSVEDTGREHSWSCHT